MSIEELKWKNRILITHQKEAKSNHLKKLKANDKALRERHMIWFNIQDGKVTSNYSGDISNQFTTSLQKQYITGDTTAVLIGKDGDVKAKYKALHLDKIFALIDTMPMRRREMRK